MEARSPKTFPETLFPSHATRWKMGQDCWTNNDQLCRKRSPYLSRHQRPGKRRIKKQSKGQEDYPFQLCVRHKLFPNNGFHQQGRGRPLPSKSDDHTPSPWRYCWQWCFASCDDSRLTQTWCKGEHKNHGNGLLQNGDWSCRSQPRSKRIHRRTEHVLVRLFGWRFSRSILLNQEEKEIVMRKVGYSSWMKKVLKDPWTNDQISLKQNEKWKDGTMNMWKRLQKETHPFILHNDQDSEGANNSKDLKNMIIKSMPKPTHSSSPTQWKQHDDWKSDNSWNSWRFTSSTEQ